MTKKAEIACVALNHLKGFSENFRLMWGHTSDATQQRVMKEMGQKLIDWLATENAEGHLDAILAEASPGTHQSNESNKPVIAIGDSTEAFDKAREADIDFVGRADRQEGELPDTDANAGTGPAAPAPAPELSDEDAAAGRSEIIR